MVSMEPVKSGGVLRLGAFELDRSSGELRKSGLKIHLREQPFRILAMLVDRPGEIVTREEIQKVLWPNDTVVEFEHSINAAIKALRAALSDDADNPRFVETLPRRGYRFIAPIAAQSPPAAQVRSLDWRRWAVVAAVLVIVIGAGAFLLRPPLPPPRVVGCTQLTQYGRGLDLGPLATDGSRVYFSEDLGRGGYSLTSVSAAGGKAVPIPTPLKDAWLEDISPDGTELLVTDRSGSGPDSPFYMVSASDGSTRRLGGVVGHCGGWLADGRIMVQKGNDTYLVNRDGSEPHKVVTTSLPAEWPRSSPDGKLIRFSLEGAALWEVGADGSNPRPLLAGWNNPPSEVAGSWTPDGKYFVFQSTRKQLTSIWAMREGKDFFHKVNREPVQLTTGPMNVSSPLPSRDGKKLFALGEIPGGEWLRYDPRSHDLRPYLAGISAWWLDFSKDGKWITYDSLPERTLWRSKLDGSERLQLTFPPMRALYPRWSHDGKQIAFMGNPPGKAHLNIYLVPVEGGTPELLLPEDQDQATPDWAPDGKRLVFSRESSSSQGLGIEIVGMGTRTVSTLPGSQGITYPRWSPDGRYLVAHDPAHDGLALFDFATHKWSELVKLGAWKPLWSPDSKSVYFFGTDKVEPGIYQVYLNGHRVERAISLVGFQGITGGGDPTFSLAPDRSLILSRYIGNQEIYALDWEAR
jgi:Tol biopolymer transport system component/DNA-binding winged helix-turn-helix (wHTH) protein